MTRPVNLYALSRITDETAFHRVEKHASGSDECKHTQTHEILSLRLLVDGLLENGISINQLDGFYFGYKIPQIGKEFDLLKFTEHDCLNIELKSQPVSTSDILSQLQKNKHYLAHIGKKLHLYTVVTSPLTCYKLTEDGHLQSIAFSCVADAIKQFEYDHLSQIDTMFRASDFLVSPLNTPEKFIDEKYFLTQAQDEIKKKILNDIYIQGQDGFYSIIGKPGTGKTLLVYDLARQLSQWMPTAIIHCGKLPETYQQLEKAINNFAIIEAGRLKGRPEIIDTYQYILVDEAHRFHLAQFRSLCDKVNEGKKICIFSSDPDQVLSSSEKQNDIVGKILALPLLEKYTLTGKIRTNKALASFIAQVIDLNLKPATSMSYDNVSLLYAANFDEACRLIEYYRQQEYVFINYSKSNFYPSPFSAYKEDYDTHHVIGQEFDKVLMLLDDSFYYDEYNKLRGIRHPNPNYLYPNLFYQGITRVREKIALIVVSAPELFFKITSIFE